jgi:hypothetical protein
MVRVRVWREENASPDVDNYPKQPVEALCIRTVSASRQPRCLRVQTRMFGWKSTLDPVYPNGARERRPDQTRDFRCGYSPSKPTRRAVNFTGEGRDPSAPHADSGCGHPGPDATRNAVQSNGEPASPIGRRGPHCGHPAPPTNRNPVHFDGEGDAPMPPKPFPHGVQAPFAGQIASLAAHTGFSTTTRRPSRRATRHAPAARAKTLSNPDQKLRSFSRHRPVPAR